MFQARARLMVSVGLAAAGILAASVVAGSPCYNLKAVERFVRMVGHSPTGECYKMSGLYRKDTSDINTGTNTLKVVDSWIYIPYYKATGTDPNCQYVRPLTEEGTRAHVNIIVRITLDCD